jgi:hypothetical protein
MSFSRYRDNTFFVVALSFQYILSCITFSVGNFPFRVFFILVSDDGFFAAVMLVQPDEKIPANLESGNGTDRRLWIVKPIAEV